MATFDRLGRPLRSLRVSVTDRCDLRCSDCMPEPHDAWLPREAILDCEEIGVVVGALAELGVERVRLTGGEPLLRADVDRVVRRIAQETRITDLALTTNGVRLAEQAAALREAGLGRVTVSLDTLRRDRFAAITGRDDHAAVLAGIAAAGRAGLVPLKIDTVVLRGMNDDELGGLVAFAREIGAEVRFIESMDVGGATRGSARAVVSRAEMLTRLTRIHGPIEPAGARGPAPAERFRLADGTTFGIIASTTAPSCAACERARVSADGVWYPCLYARSGIDLRQPLRGGAGAGALAELVRRAWQARADRGAVERRGERGRGPLIPARALRRDSHLEMHTRGR